VVNTIKVHKKLKRKMTLGELIRNHNETAFLGQAASDTGTHLYLITKAGIVTIDGSNKWHNMSGCRILVERFVDLRITVIDKER